MSASIRAVNSVGKLTVKRSMGAVLFGEMADTHLIFPPGVERIERREHREFEYGA